MNKRLLTLLIFLGIMVVAIILAFTVFTVKNIEVNVVSGDLGENINTGHIEAAADLSNRGRAKSIFSVSESSIITSIQSKWANIKVTSVQRRFPDTIVINVAVRYPILAITLSDDEIAILDREMTVIEIVTMSQFNERSGQVGDLRNVVRTNVQVPSDKAVALGENLSTVSDSFTYLQNVVVGYERIDKVDSKFTASVTEVLVNTESNKLYIKTSLEKVQGVIIEVDLQNYKNLIASMVQFAYEWYDEKKTSEDPLEVAMIYSGYISYDSNLGEYVWHAD